MELATDPYRLPSLFRTGKIGVAQSANWTGSIMPSVCSQSNYFSTCAHMAYRTERALQKHGQASGCLVNFQRSESWLEQGLVPIQYIRQLALFHLADPLSVKTNNL